MDRTNWKEKTMQRVAENKQLKKRIKELSKSRDEWKRKSISHKKRADDLEQDLKKIKDKLNEIIK